VIPRPAFPCRAAGALVALAAGLALHAPLARAQVVTDARRLGMGGVIVSEVSGSATQNVAYRAVPRSHGLGGNNTIPIPLGLLQLIVDPPEFDSDNANFNAFELANIIVRTPYTLQIIEPEPISSDIAIDIAKNGLTIDLGELQRLFPDESMKFGSTFQSPNLEFGTKNIFGGIRPQVEVRNTLDLDPTLQAALGEAAPFTPNTTYGASDFIRGQSAVAVMLGGALPVLNPGADAPDGDPRQGGKALYVGARAKYLSGVALWQADADMSVATGDTIFGSSTPLNPDYGAEVRQTTDPGISAGSGYGFDAGVAFFLNKFEIGLGVNDIGSIIDWKETDVDSFTYDSVNNENDKSPVARRQKYTTHFPTTGTLNIAYRTHTFTVAGTLDRTANERWIPRAGAETWLGPTAVRGGVYLDSYKLLQFTAGTGLQLGSVGFDLALATHSRGLTTDRGLELAASVQLGKRN